MISLEKDIYLILMALISIGCDLDKRVKCTYNTNPYPDNILGIYPFFMLLSTFQSTIERNNQPSYLPFIHPSIQSVECLPGIFCLLEYSVYGMNMFMRRFQQWNWVYWRCFSCSIFSTFFLLGRRRFQVTFLVLNFSICFLWNTFGFLRVDNDLWLS